MPYDPNALTEEQRSYFAKLTWVSAIAAFVQFGLYASGIVDEPLPILLGLAIGGPIGGIFGRAIDEYVRALCDVGARWSAAFIAAYLFAIFLMRTADVTWSTGYILGSDGEAARVVTGGLPALLNDAFFVGLTAVVFYHAGYGYAWLRNRKG